VLHALLHCIIATFWKISYSTLLWQNCLPTAQYCNVLDSPARETGAACGATPRCGTSAPTRSQTQRGCSCGCRTTMQREVCRAALLGGSSAYVYCSACSYAQEQQPLPSAAAHSRCKGAGGGSSCVRRRGEAREGAEVNSAAGGSSI
jgi:hypothetical protein